VNGLARHNFGFVLRGQKAYQILPPPTGSPPSNASALSEHVPLEGPPVVPGSPRAEALLGLAATAPAASTSVSVRGSPGAAAPTGYWGRVVRSLEFWR
jgi:hypothetical protein